MGGVLEPVREVLLDADDDPLLKAMDLDATLLCVRAGSLEMLEFLSEEKLLEVNRTLPLVPDITPAFWPWKAPKNSRSHGRKW